MSGFEIAGVVLGAIPLFYYFVKKCRGQGGIDALRDHIGPENWKDELPQLCPQLCEDFRYQIYKLEGNLRALAGYLPDISQSCKRRLEEGSAVDWENEQEAVAQSMRKLWSTDDIRKFELIMFKVRDTLGRLLDETNQDPETMMSRLRSFHTCDERDHTTQVSIRAFFKRLKRVKVMKTCIKRMKECNNNLEALRWTASQIVDRSETDFSAIRLHVDPAQTRLERDLSKTIFTTLGTNWACHGGHEAHFSLVRRADSHANLVCFDFLIPRNPPDDTWCEAAIMIEKPSSMTNRIFQDCDSVDSVCEEFQMHTEPEQCLQLLVEEPNDGTAAQLRKVHWHDSRLEDWVLGSATSLKTLLEQWSGAKPTRSERRRLALLFAHSILQLHESPFPGSLWDKENIFFLQNCNRAQPDLEVPYIKTEVSGVSKVKETKIVGPYHRNPAILNLGILLVELEEWKPWESYLTSTEPSTNNFRKRAARRAVKSMRNSLANYKDAIGHCIELDWSVSGTRVSLDDEDTQKAMYLHIISLLREEVPRSQRKG
ncbi:hypothetical protein QBC41DRAFT_279933 [Cercophora samala]|uniref:DUF7580 domain-containing protein n=1 Tax=Cercophora samala TaxID=330535 RepID=A0AA39Z9V4_9PEZI|nr:hypothetical protein QBC41DRAFT_279933 [Cercophora samala]